MARSGTSQALGLGPHQLTSPSVPVRPEVSMHVLGAVAAILFLAAIMVVTHRVRRPKRTVPERMDGEPLGVRWYPQLHGVARDAAGKPLTHGYQRPADVDETGGSR